MRGNSVLLVSEPDYFTAEPCWTFPSGHVERGEDSADAAARELAEESGCIITPSALELISVTDVQQDGETISRSWNYTATTSEAASAPRVQGGETVTEARWFSLRDAATLLGRSPYAPKREPAIRFLTSAERQLHWTFDLVDSSTPVPTFRWEPPVKVLD